KARYYDQRFIPAMEAFNYVLYKYWTSDKINETRIWREKVNIRLENEELALKTLQRMLRLEKLSPRLYADAHAVMAQAYINLGDTEKAIQSLETAAESTGNHEEKGRYYYITGQLYNRLGAGESANAAFDKIIALNRKTLRVYVINAHLEKIRNASKDTVNDAALLEFITALEEDYENNAFLDKIYREKAMFYAKRDSFPLMENYLNKSLRAATTDTYLKAYNYETLAQFRFDNARYKDAGAYYDSTLTNLDRNSEKYRLIKKKRDNLNDVIRYEGIAQETDSILHLTAMNDDEKKVYFEQYIQALKDKEKQQAEAARNRNQDQSGGLTAQLPGNKAKGDVVFYFYNPVTLQYGRNEFRRIWGDRKLEDNWRLENKTAVAAEDEVTSSEKKAITDKYDVNYYLSKLPSEQRRIDSIKTARNEAYYQLGLLYKEKFREYGLAVEKLESLLRNEPGERLTLQAKYDLYKTYEAMQSPLADAVKNDIITNHPDSRYAAFLSNPGVSLSDDAPTSETLYTELFRAFENQEYETVIERSEQYIARLGDDPVVPKFEMLKALATARLKGLNPYKEALDYIALNYPNTEAGKEAGRIVKEELRTLQNETFADTASASGWKLVFPVRRPDEKKVEKLAKTIVKSLEELKYDYLNASKDIYDGELIFIVVHGFESEDRALGYAELLSINKKYRIRDESFPITSENYRIVQIHKNLDAYKKEKLKL
ncbi:MAG: tetratricopeptide repeat protein, partial [Sinomicrobium sp.]|nr:tetratricopeptide repeat protein [Sinomicrobium sp.]